MRDRVFQESGWDAAVMLFFRRDRGLHGLHTEGTRNSPHTAGEGIDNKLMSRASFVTSINVLAKITEAALAILGHILRMPESRVVRHALVALAKGGTVYPKGSLFMDCQAMEMHQLVALAQRRGA